MPVMTEPFWGYTRGERRYMSEMPLPARGVIFQELKTGDAVMQYQLPLDGKEDSLVWKPEKERERVAQDEARIDEVRRLLQRSIRI